MNTDVFMVREEREEHEGRKKTKVI